MQKLSSQTRIAAISMAVLLTGCGGGKLSFKNADKVVKSYTKVVADMTEAERQTFNRNVILILEDNDTPPEELTLGDWQSATNRGSELSYLSGESNGLIKEFASELALKGADSLNGKSASYVNKRGKAIKADIAKAAAKTTEGEITAIEENIKNIASEKADHVTAYEVALDQKKAMNKKMEIYKAKAKVTGFSKNWRGEQMDLDLSIINPYEDNIYDTRLNADVEYEGYTASYSFNVPMTFKRPKTGATGHQTSAISLNARDFSKESGEILDKGHVFPKDKGLYKVTLRPVWVRTSSKKNGWKEYDFKISNEDNNRINRHANNLKPCDDLVSGLEEKIKVKKTRLESIKAVKFDELEREGYWGSGRTPSCAPR